MKMSTTHKQAELLAYIKAHIADNDGTAPSYEDMMHALGLASKSGVQRLLTALEERGLIARKYNRARCIVVLPDDIFDGIPTSALVAELARRSGANRRAA